LKRGGIAPGHYRAGGTAGFAFRDQPELREGVLNSAGTGR
jgi:hypothetical protein